MDEKENATINEFFDKASTALADYGQETAINLLRNHLNNWRSQPIHVAVTGSVNAGKSTFTNVIRGLEDGDEGAANTDVVENTTEPRDYPHPENLLLVYADLPGVGTPKNPRNETYIQNMRFTRYDAFLILSESSFTEDDKWLANQIDDLGKPFFFVRTKIDQDISNNKRKRKSENETKQKVRANLEFYLDAVTEEERQNIFLISNFEEDQHDFPRLLIAITESLPAIKQEALAYSLKNFSIEIVNEKIKYLEARATKVALLSAACAAIPFPGVSAFMDVALIIEEFNHYHSQLCFAQHHATQPDSSSSNLQKGAEKVSTESLKVATSTKIKEEIKKKLSEAMSSVTAKEVTAKLKSMFSEEVRNKLSEYIGLNVVEEFTRYIPAAGSVISAGLSFYTTRNLLLNKIKELGDRQKAYLNASDSSQLENMMERL